MEITTGCDILHIIREVLRDVRDGGTGAAAPEILADGAPVWGGWGRLRDGLIGDAYLVGEREDDGRREWGNLWHDLEGPTVRGLLACARPHFEIRNVQPGLCKSAFKTDRVSKGP